MTPRRRLVAVGAIAAAVFCFVSGLLVVWRAHRALRQSAAELDAQQSVAVDIRPVDLNSGSRFDWLTMPAVFRGGAVFDGHLYLCGPAGLFEYSDTGEMLHVYRVGQQLPASPLVALAAGTLSDAHRPELLVATAGSGVLAFDGEHFRRIAVLSAAGQGAQDAEANNITALLPLSSGRLLLGTAKRGLLVYDGRHVQSFHAALAGLYITALAGSESELWVGTLDQGVYHWQGGEATRIAEAEGLPDAHVNAIALGDAAAYVATPVGVAEIAQGRVQRVLAAGVFAQALYRDRDGRDRDGLAVGSIDQGLLNVSLAGAGEGLRNGVGRRRIAAQEAAPATYAGAIAQIFSAGPSSSDTLYAVAEDGLYQKDAAGFGWSRVVAPAPSMLADRNVSALAVDAEGRLWVGYFDRGLDILSASGDRATHVENSRVYCVNRIVPDAEHRTVNVATANGLAVFDDAGRQRAVLGLPAGLIAEHVTDVALYRGGMALATPAGLTFMDATGVHSLYAFQGLVNNHVYALAMRGDRLLAGTLGGLSILDSDNVSRNLTTTTSGLKHNWITAVAPLDDGWLVGTYGAGVERLDADNHVEATDATLQGVEINPNALLVTPEHVLAGTLGNGLMVFNRRSSRWRTIAGGLPSLNVTAFAARGATLYIGTDNGIVSIPESRLDE